MTGRLAAWLPGCLVDWLVGNRSKGRPAADEVQIGNFGTVDEHNLNLAAGDHLAFCISGIITIIWYYKCTGPERGERGSWPGLGFAFVPVVLQLFSGRRVCFMIIMCATRLVFFLSFFFYFYFLLYVTQWGIVAVAVVVFWTTDCLPVDDYYVCLNSMHVPALKLICIEYD